MDFGVFIPQGWRLDLAGIPTDQHWQTMLDIARRADAGPWKSIWVYDHFHTVPIPTEEATHEAWTLMAAFAASTSRVRLGQMCTCMGYRNPAYLAKVAATCDVISGGRIEMGIGAGWYEHEWKAYGYGFPGAGDRLAMLDEGVQIMQQLWTEGVATFNALPGRWRDLPAAAAAGGRDPVLDCWRGREEDAPHGSQVRQVHKLRRHSGDVPTQVRDPRRALPRHRPRLRRDHPFGQLQRGHRQHGERSGRQDRVDHRALRTTRPSRRT
jgi:alkanesulfonate monooxygenase SsuD/methylene tetrahydromethanopterin reductase-like flavin-dependent oxidoreductase (luciferase family)